MIRVFPLPLLLLFAMGDAAAVERAVVDLRMWTVTPQSGAALVNHPELSGVVRGLLSLPDGRLELRYPGGDEGTLRANEMRAWLIALGIDADRVEMVPGSGDPASMIVTLLPRQIERVR